jgi:hypothetical protein
MLTQEKVKELFHYEPDTGNLVWRFDRRANKVAGKIAGCLNNHGYFRIRIDGKAYSAHRIIWLYVYGAWPVNDIDHVNGLRHDNRICNLREATKAQNSQNQRKPQSHNTSGYLGVSAYRGKWKATIKLSGNNLFIGYYNTPEEAYSEYLSKKRELHPFGTL